MGSLTKDLDAYLEWDHTRMGTFIMGNGRTMPRVDGGSMKIGTLDTDTQDSGSKIENGDMGSNKLSNGSIKAIILLIKRKGLVCSLRMGFDMKSHGKMIKNMDKAKLYKKMAKKERHII